jgi:hypothetical protein
MAKSATAKRRSVRSPPAKRRASPQAKAGASIQTLLMQGRAMDVADTMAGLHGSACRVGRSLNALIMQVIDKVDPAQVSHEQLLALGELSVGMSDASTRAHDSLVKARAPDDDGKPPIDVTPVSALALVAEKFRSMGKANG